MQSSLFYCEYYCYFCYLFFNHLFIVSVAVSLVPKKHRLSSEKMNKCDGARFCRLDPSTGGAMYRKRNTGTDLCAGKLVYLYGLCLEVQLHCIYSDPAFRRNATYPIRF